MPFKELSSDRLGTTSRQMREQVIAARQIEQRRFAGTRARHNAQMNSRQIRELCPLDAESINLLKASVNEMGLSARAHDKILRVARTIADLDGSEAIGPAHINEAINYRMLDRTLWT